MLTKENKSFYDVYKRKRRFDRNIDCVLNSRRRHHDVTHWLAVNILKPQEWHYGCQNLGLGLGVLVLEPEETTTLNMLNLR